MKQIDLDDLPPRVARILAGLEGEDELILVRGGAVVARLRLAELVARAPADEGSPPEGAMKEILEHFSSIIHDEF